MYKRLLTTTFIICAATLTYNSVIKRTKGFSIEKILSYKQPDNRFIPPPLSKELQATLFDQPYTYLGSGKQTYVFASQDGQYVIKFFKQKHFSHSPWKSVQTNLRHKQVRDKTFASYCLAYNYLHDSSGVVYHHLTRTNSLGQLLKLQDNSGAPFTLNLDKVQFLVQKRADPIFASIDTFVLHGDTDSAKKSIDSILSLITTRYKTGIANSDINCEKNMGLIGTKAIEIDIGEFALMGGQSHSLQEELCSGTQDLDEQLRQTHPELAHYLQTQLQKVVYDFSR